MLDEDEVRGIRKEVKDAGRREAVMLKGEVRDRAPSVEDIEGGSEEATHSRAYDDGLLIPFADGGAAEPSSSS